MKRTLVSENSGTTVSVDDLMKELEKTSNIYIVAFTSYEGEVFILNTRKEGAKTAAFFSALGSFNNECYYNKANTQQLAVKNCLNDIAESDYEAFVFDSYGSFTHWLDTME